MYQNILKINLYWLSVRIHPRVAKRCPRMDEMCKFEMILSAIDLNEEPFFHYLEEDKGKTQQQQQKTARTNEC